MIAENNLIKGFVPFLDQYDGEFIMNLTPETMFIVAPHFHDGKYYGININAICPYTAEMYLLETVDDMQEAIEFLQELQEL